MAVSQQMLRLPTIHDSRESWALPLADSSAERLVRLLILADASTAYDALQADPFLLLWCLFQQELRDADAIDVSSVAQWLLANALDRIQPVAIPLDAAAADETDVAVWTELANNRPASSPDALASRLSDWRDLLASCGAECHASGSEIPAVLRTSPLRPSAGSPSPSAASPRWRATGDHAELLVRLLEQQRHWREYERTFAEKLEQEKMASLKEFAYGASHEINNPLANISTRAQTLLRDETDPERRRLLATINSQAFRAHEMISDVMLFARPPEVHPELADVADVIESVVAELNDDAQQQGTAIDIVCQTPLSAVIDPVHMSVALKAVCRNSLEALRAGGRIRIDAARSTDDDGLTITVADSGPGIPPEVRRHLFDPYYSGREAGRGLGLGLSKCWRIVEQHGGRIEVASQPESGTTFSIVLPHACPTIRTAG